MTLVRYAISLLLVGFLVHSAVGKLSRNQKQIEGMRAVNFPVERIGWLATAELAAATGLLVGLVWWPVAIAALAGLIAYFVGALVFLLRARLTRFAALFPAMAFLVATLALSACYLPG
ncbi:MAG TPA: DoxX family protein [Pseudonocardiaceae bacterium]|jgi:hypothetical protein|nr:DoxX family protein [Pseudonocardiaceae bacterium]